MSEGIGIIGLGLLGSAVAGRLLSSGRSVAGYDVQEDRVRELVGLGGTALTSTSAVFAWCRVTFLVLPDSNVVATLLEGAQDFHSDAVVIDLTTGDPDQMANFGARLASRGVAYIDATVGGSSQQVRDREAIIMAGGETVVVDRHRELLGTLAREVFHVGPWGSGAKMKLAMNLVLGLNRAVLAEGLAFASAMGLSMDDALQVFRSGPAWSRVMDLKGRRMIDHDFVPVARLSQHRKDVDLILAASARNGARTPLSRVHRELLAGLECEGYGAEDNSAIIRAFEMQGKHT